MMILKARCLNSSESKQFNRQKSVEPQERPGDSEGRVQYWAPKEKSAGGQRRDFKKEHLHARKFSHLVNQDHAAFPKITSTMDSI